MKSSREIKILLTYTSLVAYLKTQSVLELLNSLSNLSTVAYKGVAYKKNRVLFKSPHFRGGTSFLKKLLEGASLILIFEE